MLMFFSGMDVLRAVLSEYALGTRGFVRFRVRMFALKWWSHVELPSTYPIAALRWIPPHFARLGILLMWGLRRSPRFLAVNEGLAAIAFGSPFVAVDRQPFLR